LRNIFDIVIKAYYAILLFICIGFKPFYTIGYVAYYELNVDYIIEKYCVNKSKPKFKCNGKCHLTKKISFASSLNTENNQKANSNSLSESFFPVFFQKSNFKVAVIELLNQQKIDSFLVEENYNISLSITSPPPRC